MPALSDVMVFLPYTPRADADARGYDDWLRQVDNPFFNAVPGIVHYSNWKVAGAAKAFAFSHFDFMYLDPSRADGVWSNAAVLAFAAAWTARWGAFPDAADVSLNYHSYRLTRRDGADSFDRRGVRLGMLDAPPGHLGGTVWEVDSSLVGTPACRWFEFRFGPLGDAALPGVAGELIAAPGE